VGKCLTQSALLDETNSFQEIADCRVGWVCGRGDPVGTELHERVFEYRSQRAAIAPGLVDGMDTDLDIQMPVPRVYNRGDDFETLSNAHGVIDVDGAGWILFCLPGMPRPYVARVVIDDRYRFVVSVILYSVSSHEILCFAVTDSFGDSFEPLPVAARHAVLTRDSGPHGDPHGDPHGVPPDAVAAAGVTAGSA
jgi:hypothetical protein